jgi:DNA-directed RNA polymerase
MSDQQLNAVKEPQHQQLELESWCRSTGADRILSTKWEKGASGTLTQRLATLYLEKVLEIYDKSHRTPGRQQHIWALMSDKKSVIHVALETLAYVIGNLNEERPFTQLATTIGKRAEYVLWLQHPQWGRSMHLQGLKLATNNDLNMGLVRKRLIDQGFRKAAAYHPLKHVERAALGAFFIECIAESTKMIEVVMKTVHRKRHRWVRYTPLYWQFLERWKDAVTMFRPLYMPMMVPPREWTGHTGGGYLSIATQVSPVDWTRWPEVSKRMQPCVLDSINLLQEQPYQIDEIQMGLLEACWNLGHQVGSVPARHRVPEPVDNEYKVQGLGPSAYWKAVWKWKSDQRRDGERSRIVNTLVAHRRLGDARPIWFCHHMDHRGRVYSRGSQLNIQGPDHQRSLLQFDERSPIKGHEREFAWSLGGALGLAPDPKERERYLDTMSAAIVKAGNDPLGSLAYWADVKEPWRFIQLCRDWAGYIENPGYQSGTIHWLDQTCSGWGHVACLTGDAQLAQYTNVTGRASADLYTGLGKLVVARLKWIRDHEEMDERRTKTVAWWCRHRIPRSLWKKVLMPIIYGRSYLSLAETIKLYLRDEVEDFLTEEGLRIVDLALVLATITTKVVNEALPNVRDLSRWLTQLSNMQIDAGHRAYWFTPNGLAVECYQSDSRQDQIELTLGRRTISVGVRDATGCPVNKRRTSRKLVPDFVHSMDAAFLQRFVAHWATYDHPIATVHDCFGTTLEHVGTLQSELNDQWHRFYSVDHLTRHQGMVEMVLGKEVPAPPIVGTLDRSKVGENPFLFS